MTVAKQEWLKPMEGIFEILNEGVGIADDAGHILFVNRCMERLLGSPRSTLNSEPNLTAEEIQSGAGERDVDPLREFRNICRSELYAAMHPDKTLARETAGPRSSQKCYGSEHMTGLIQAKCPSSNLREKRMAFSVGFHIRFS